MLQFSDHTLVPRMRMHFVTNRLVRSPVSAHPPSNIACKGGRIADRSKKGVPVRSGQKVMASISEFWKPLEQNLHR